MTDKEIKARFEKIEKELEELSTALTNLSKACVGLAENFAEYTTIRKDIDLELIKRRLI